MYLTEKVTKNLFLVHLFSKSVDVLFSVAKVTSFDKVVGDFSPAASRSRKLDRVEPVIGLFEVGTDGVKLVNQVFDTVEAEVTETGFDN